MAAARDTSQQDAQYNMALARMAGVAGASRQSDENDQGPGPSGASSPTTRTQQELAGTLARERQS